MTAAEIDEGAVDRLLTVLGEHGRIERDLARKAIIAALPAPADARVAWPVTPEMIAAGWDCLKRPNVRSMPTLGPGMGLKEAYLAMRALEPRQAPAPRQEIMEVQRLRSLLEYRDEFIVSQGLWQTFVDGLPRAALGVAGQEPKGGR
jgi:hypothetical protein